MGAFIGFIVGCIILLMLVAAGIFAALTGHGDTAGDLFAGAFVTAVVLFFVGDDL